MLNLNKRSTSTTFPQLRMRRLRRTPALRALVEETQLAVTDFIAPLFVRFDNQTKVIDSMPGQYQHSIDSLIDEAKCLSALGIPGVLLFGIPETKDATGSDSLSANGIIAKATRALKQACPELIVIADTCFCEYTDHGHCGIMDQDDVNNDATLEILAEQAVIQAEAGVDIIAPSAAMDGMVAAIRNGLDNAGFQDIPILSYAVKYASAFYGPFRDAVESAPQMGDRKSYQMNPANSAEALREVELDLAEGADMLMVKPALNYLDIIHRVKQSYPEVPLSAYQVSGEYAMIKAAAANGWIDEKQVAFESLIAIKRAGADFIFSYFAKDVAGWLAAPTK